MVPFMFTRFRVCFSTRIRGNCFYIYDTGEQTGATTRPFLQNRSQTVFSGSSFMMSTVINVEAAEPEAMYG